MNDVPLGARNATCRTARPFGDVDLLSAEHRLDTSPQTRFFGQLKQQSEGFGGYAIFRVVEVDARSLRGHPFAPLPVTGKEVTQVETFHFLVVPFQNGPHGSLT
jgi:hypothetical protein